jgi:DNA-binding winged helix-turn-helix (wHTH) protein/Tol biopolymer transport system component
MSVPTVSTSDFRVGEWLVRPSLAEITRGSETVHVTPRSMAVLVYLADARGSVVSRNEILDEVWPGMSVTPDALSQCVVELRKAFRDDSRHPTVIQTIPKLGIRLVSPVTRIEPSAATDIPEAVKPLAQPAAAPEVEPQPAPLPRSRPRWSVLSSQRAVATGLVAIAIGAAALLWTTRANTTWRDPLVGADFTRVTDFIGAEEHAAISRDGRFVAFVSDRDGAWDVFVGQIGSGHFQNLTRASIPELRNPFVRMLDFSVSGAEVWIWAKAPGPNGLTEQSWSVPVVGGNLRPGRTAVAELAWSWDGKHVVYHPAVSGDPLFVASSDGSDRGKQIYIAPPGIHCHFPVWSRDGKTIYFVRGFVPDEMDIWRIAATGGEPERLTSHNSRVSFPTLLNEQTLLYLATSTDGSGPWIHALDLEHRTTHRVKAASNAYTSLAATPDGRRLIATEPHPTASLWSLRLTNGIAGSGDITPIPIRTQRGVAPRFGSGSLLYRAPKAGTDALWRHEGGAGARELWSGVEGRVIDGPALTRDGQRVAFTVQSRGKTRLHTMSSDGSGVRQLAQELEVRGSPAWSPDGQWIAIAAMNQNEPRLYKIPAAGGPAVLLTQEYALDPVWSPSGRFLVYTTADLGTVFELKAVSAEGAPYPVPKLVLNRGSRRLAFLGADEGTLVMLKGTLARKEFWAVDLRSGEQRPLTNLGPGELIGDFDVSADGRSIVFDRVREESDIALIELARQPDSDESST